MADDPNLDTPYPLTRWQLASALRDWIHETPLSECNAGADTCPDWSLAFEVADRILDHVYDPRR